MANGFTQTAEIVKDDLSRRPKFIVVFGEQVAAKQCREVSVRLKTGHDGRSVQMQDAEHLFEAMKG